MNSGSEFVAWDEFEGSESAHVFVLDKDLSALVGFGSCSKIVAADLK